MRQAATVCLILLALAGCREPRPADGEEGILLSKAMGEGAGAGFERARTVRQFSFPGDHGPHREYRTEWWYFTGNLATAGGREFGYQVTIFRIGLSAGLADRGSAWAAQEIYMGHIGLTDVLEDDHSFEERFVRGAAGLAGAVASPLRVWLEDWEIRQAGDGLRFQVPQLRITAALPGAEIDLTLEATKPLVLQGDQGLSRKGPEPGNASYYYSSTRMRTEGRITKGGVRHAVSGASWMDREWSTSALGSEVEGWDWFALHLSDSTEIMYYQLRRSDGTPDTFSKGALVSPAGTAEPLTSQDVVLSATDRWLSPGGVSYPSGWRLRIPSRGIDLSVTPKVKAQLMDVSVKYWEGAVAIEGVRNRTKVSGSGYAELAGYRRKP
jgi:predicted secreted hydrolase